MSGLPEGWAEAAGSDTFELIRGVSYKKVDARSKASEGLIPILRATNIQDSRLILDDLVYVPEMYVSPQQRLKPGDILIATSSGSRDVVGKSVRIIDVDKPYAFGAFCAVARPRSETLSNYLSYYTRSRAYRNYVEEVALGININNFRTSDLSALPLCLPPEQEQRRIVAKLDSLFERTRRAREELSQIPRLIEHYKKAILEAAFRGDLTRDWRERKSLPGLEEVVLGDVANGFSYGSSSKSSPTGRVPVLRMGNIQNMALDWSDLVYTSNDQEIEKYRLTSRDVLFNRTNSPELVGKTALYQGEQPAIYAGYLIRIRCGSQLLPEYLNYCLNSPIGRTYCWRVKSDGVSQSNINAKKLAAFPFLLPVIEEQQEIVRRIEEALGWLNIVDAEHGQARHLLDRLDQAHLAKAFRGELVPQDPNDEPASVLLDRIRGEQAGEARIRRGRRRRVGIEQEAMA